MVQLHQLKLDVFTQEKVCQQLNTYMEERQVGASRIYALFLLIKKILVFLASSESMRRREYIAPNTWNSWTCVDSICSDSNTGHPRHRKFHPIAPIRLPRSDGRKNCTRTSHPQYVSR